MVSLLLIAAATVLALLLGRALRQRVGFVAQVESDSMAPTLVPGQWLLVRRPTAAHPLHRGDVVVVDSRELGRPVVKRVVGMPGERVGIGADGRVQVAGHPLAEPYVHHEGGRPASFRVPAGHLLLLGDHRARSSDARTWREPYLPLSAVLGRVVTGPSGRKDPVRDGSEGGAD